MKDEKGGNTTSQAEITPPLKWFIDGGKQYLAKRIVAMMPPHLHYVEPYAGGLAVLLERDPNDESLWLPGHKGVSEVANDLDNRLMNFWSVLRDPSRFGHFQRMCEATPLCRQGFDEAAKSDACFPIESAYAFFVQCRQSRAGTFKGFTSLTRSRVRRGINGNASEWLGAVEGLPAVHARLWPVVLENKPALELIRSEDAPDTLFYLDPPYLHETRTGDGDYKFEMTKHEHNMLLSVLTQIKGRFLLSGYKSELYDRYALDCGWYRTDFQLPNNAAGGKKKRTMTECVWQNF